MYDISDLEIFLMLSKTQSISKTAEQLNMAQSTISKKLKNLEEELGTTLVERSKGTKTFSMTPAGTHLLEIANQITALWSKAHGLNSHNFKPMLTLASLSSLNQSIFPSILSHMHQEIPDLKMNILTIHSPEVYDLVESRQADIGFTLIEKITPTTIVRKWFSEPMVIVRSPEYKCPKNKIFSPQELNPEEEIFYATGTTFTLWHDQWFSPADQCNIQIDSISLVPYLLDDVNHWSILPLTIARFIQQYKPYKIFSLSVRPPDRVCYTVTHKFPTANTLKVLEYLTPYLDKFSESDYHIHF